MALTRHIRRAIVQDKQLSTYAHNVKIITEQGQVTLKGPVRTADEKQAVEAKATESADAGHVRSEVSVTNRPAKRHGKHKACMAGKTRLAQGGHRGSGDASRQRCGPMGRLPAPASVDTQNRPLMDT